MEHILIHKSGVAYADGVTTGAWQIQSLTDGAIAAFEKDGTLIDALAPVLTNSEVYFALGRTSVNTIASAPMLTPIIDRESLKYSKYSYVAPVARKTFVGYTGAAGCLQSLHLPTSLTVGDRISITLVDLDLAHEVTRRHKTYDISAVGGDLLTGNTSANIVNRLITLVNADPNRFATLTAVLNGADVAGISVDSVAGRNIGVVLDNKVSFNSITGSALVYNVIGDADITEGVSTAGGGTSAVINGITYNATSAPTLAAVSGNATTLAINYSAGEGTSVKMIEVEDLYSTHHGNIRAPHMTTNLYKDPSRVVNGETYIQYHLEWNVAVNNKLADRQLNPTQQLILAIPSGDAVMIAAMDTILAAL